MLHLQLTTTRHSYGGAFFVGRHGYAMMSTSILVNNDRDHGQYSSYASD